MVRSDANNDEQSRSSKLKLIAKKSLVTTVMDHSAGNSSSGRASLSTSSGRIGWIPNNAVYNKEDSVMDFTGNQSTRLLRLKIFRGQNLAKKDIFGASDPYVRINLLRNDQSVIDSVYTKTKKKTLNPTWNEEFFFRVIPTSHQLLIEVFDENRLTRDDFLGKVELSLIGIADEGPGTGTSPKRYILQQRSNKSKVRGNLEIYHAYIDSSISRASFSESRTRITDENSIESDWEIVTHPSTNNFDNEVVNEFSNVLPAGWEECQDTNGRTYYVNHNLRTTQWERPLNASTDGLDRMPEEGEPPCCPEQDALSQQQHNFDLAQDFYRRFHIGSSSDHSSTSAPNAEATQSSTTSADNASLLPSTDESPTYQQSQINLQNTRTKSLTIAASSSVDSSESSSGDNALDAAAAVAAAAASQPSADLNNDDDSQPNSYQPDSIVSENITESPEQQQALDTAASTTTADIASSGRRHSEPSSSSANVDSGSSESASQSSDQASQPSEEQTQRPQRHHHHSHPDQTHHSHHRRHHRHRHSQPNSSDQPPPPPPPANHHRSRTHQQSGDSPSRRSSSLNNADDGLGPLPTGWSQQVAQTGRIFFIDHNSRTTTWVDPRTNKPSPSPQSHHGRMSSARAASKTLTVDNVGPLPQGWEERVHGDGRIFFINHNTRTTQWEDPRIDNPKIAGPVIPFSRDYKQKYEYLQNSLQRPTNVPNKFEIKVGRTNILEDSFRIISNVSRVDYLKTKLWIVFDNEEVLDYGGASREWFYLLSKEMFNPYYGLFEYSSADKYTLQIKTFSGRCNESHLAYFKFIGRVAGMAIYHGKLLDAFFIRPFYKMMLGKEIQLKDMESVDSEYFNSLKYILDNDPSELSLNFSIDEKFLDVVEEKELKPGGSQIPVTNENKLEYINLVIEWRFVSRVKSQMSSYLEGFHEIIPKKVIEIFDENELELLMCGIGNVDVKDWKHNTVYKGGYHQNHIVIQWFWRVVLSFNNEMRSRLLQFVTGTSRVPMNGFKELYGSNGPQLFTIEKWGTPQNLPRSHTCFNRIDLPCYEAYSDLRDKLIKAIEGSETFGGVD